MTRTRFADIILPLAVRGRFTYMVPESIIDYVKPGMRVIVPFSSNRLYTGIICALHDQPPAVRNIRTVSELIDIVPSVNEMQLKLWLWISEYYMCSEGEVMKAALPSEISLNNYKQKLENYIILARKFSDDELNKILDSLKKAPRQQELLLSWLRLSGYGSGSPDIPVRKSSLLAESHSTPAAFETLASKGVLSSRHQPVSRISDEVTDMEPVKKLSAAQSQAFNSIKNHFNEKDIVLVHGVTSSGKTEIYIHLIEEQIKIINPKIIISLGRISAQSLLNTKIPISKLRGRFYQHMNIPLMPTFHPAYLLRNPKDKNLTWEDAQKVLERLKRP